MIYLTLLMDAAVRSLSLWLIVWIATAASFPLCCWSMAGAHDHHARQDASAIPVQLHAHHHGNGDSAALGASAPALSAIPAHDCHTQSMEAVATPRVSLSSTDLHCANAICVDPVVTQASAAWREGSDSAPPGSISASAFLNPLRI
ncbi:MAG TPA: hypothetical protein VGC23_01900 [Vicinamibacterales bacterium]